MTRRKEPGIKDIRFSQANSTAYTHVDLDKVPTMYLGRNSKRFTESLKHTSPEELTRFIVALLTHEQLHQSTHKVAGRKATAALDNPEPHDITFVETLRRLKD